MGKRLTIADVMLLVGRDLDEARGWLAEERASKRPRASLVRELEELVAELESEGRGEVEQATRSHLEAVRREGQMDTRGEALAAGAVALSKLIDGADPPTSVAGWHREWRDTLAEIAKEAPGGDDPDSWVAALSADIRDPKV